MVRRQYFTSPLFLKKNYFKDLVGGVEYKRERVTGERQEKHIIKCNSS